LNGQEQLSNDNIQKSIAGESLKRHTSQKKMQLTSQIEQTQNHQRLIKRCNFKEKDGSYDFGMTQILRIGNLKQAR